jgi:16S rRNA (cytosine967-C5)-methyltransferase
VPVNVPQAHAELRELVVTAVHRCLASRVFLRDSLAAEFERTGFPSRLRGPASDLASSVVRRLLTLDHLLALSSNTPLRKLEPMLLDVLRTGACEVLFVPSVPAHASVSECVNLAKRLVRPEAASFANAVLRRLLRTVEKTFRIRGRFQPSASDLLIDPDLVVRFRRPVFPDPASDLPGCLEAVFAVPRWLVERWLAHFGRARALRILEASNSRPPVTVRVNTLKTTDDALQLAFAQAAVRTAPGNVEHSLRILSPVELSSLPSFAAGEFYIQDLSAMHAPVTLRPGKGERVLDLCAAPGGKTTHLAQLAQDRAEVFALDASPARIALVEDNARRLGIRSIRTSLGDARRISDAMKHRFDAVLADVPCSNTGVLRRRVEARHRLTPETLARMPAVQADILRTALAAARPTGRVVYSTCSIEPEENHLLVRSVLEQNPHWSIDAEETLLPRSRGPDGAYVARLVYR